MGGGPVHHVYSEGGVEVLSIMCIVGGGPVHHVCGGWGSRYIMCVVGGGPGTPCVWWCILGVLTEAFSMVVKTPVDSTT